MPSMMCCLRGSVSGLRPVERVVDGLVERELSSFLERGMQVWFGEREHSCGVWVACFFPGAEGGSCLFGFDGSPESACALHISLGGCGPR